MAGRRTNLALLVLLAGALTSGALMYGIGSGWNRWPTLTHGAIGVAIILLSPLKSAIGRRSFRRRGAGAGSASIILSALVFGVLVTGFVHRVGVRHVVVMQIHVALALLVVPFALWHVVARPVRPRRTDVSRRTVLQGGLIAGASTLVTVSLPHAGGRVTRSLPRGSFDPDAMPVTQWFDDSVRRIDETGWRLRVGERSWSLDELTALALDERVATLDCTGGWYAEQRWAGVAFDRLLDASGTGGGRSIKVTAATGYNRRFPYGDASHLLLATRVGDAPLSAGHGFPARVVAPNRRGFWWVKWVTDIEVDDRPWWWQSPFPLS